MNPQFTQPKGPVSKETNKEAIARMYGIKKAEVAYLASGSPVDGYKVLYDKTTQSCWFNSGAIGNIVSWSISGSNIVLITSVGTFSLLPYAPILDCPDINSLRNTPPIFEGQKINVSSYYADQNTGGGKFISVMGTPIDDGGYTIVPNTPSNMYWSAIDDTVKLSRYGVYTVPQSDVVIGNALKDHAPAINKAVARAVYDNKPLVSEFPRTFGPSGASSTRFGIKISSFIDISGVRELRGNFVFFLIASEFSGGLDLGTGTYWALLNRNTSFNAEGAKTYSTTKGQQKIDYIYVKNVVPRDVNYPLNGQLHITSNSIITDSLASEEFYGHGVWLADSYDNSIDNIMTRRCGTPTMFAQRHTDYPVFTDRRDESNSNTINNIMSHDDFDRMMYYTGTKMVISRVHQESGHVSTNAWGLPASPSMDNTLTEEGYINNYFQFTGGFIGEFNGNNNASSSNVGPIVTMHRLVANGYGTWMTDYHDYFVPSFNLDTRCGSVLHCSSGKVTVTPNTRVTFDLLETYGIDAGGTILNAGDVMLNGLKVDVGVVTTKGDLNITSGNNSIGNLEILGNLNISNGESTLGYVSVSGNVVDTTFSTYDVLSAVGNVTLSRSRIQKYSTSATAVTTINDSAYIGWANATGTWVINGYMELGGGTAGNITATTSFNASHCVINNLAHTGASAPSKVGNLESVHVNGSMYLGDYSKYKINTCEVVGTLNLSGVGGNNYIEDTIMQTGSFNITSGSFAVQGTTSLTPLAVWALTNNSAPLGTLCVHPVTGLWYRKTSTGWVSF